MTQNEIETKKPIWNILSRLYMETHISDEAIKGFWDQFSHSPYSINEIKQIQLDEVAPVFNAKLFFFKSFNPVYDDWGRVDEYWLIKQILSNKKSSQNKRRTLLDNMIWRWHVRHTEKIWERITMGLYMMLVLAMHSDRDQKSASFVHDILKKLDCPHELPTIYWTLSLYKWIIIYLLFGNLY